MAELSDVFARESMLEGLRYFAQLTKLQPRLGVVGQGLLWLTSTGEPLFSPPEGINS